MHSPEAGASGAAGQATPEGARADVRMSEAGPGSEAGRATPEGARADGATTPTRTGGTLHMHSVADTARRRVRGKRSGKKRQLEASSRAMAEEAEAAAGKHARTEPRPDT